MLIPDPSTDVVLVDNTSTLRISGINNHLDLWTVTEDYRNKSALNGFAAIGGLWTFLNGFFEFLFGSSLLMVLFGMSGAVMHVLL